MYIDFCTAVHVLLSELLACRNDCWSLCVCVLKSSLALVFIGTVWLEQCQMPFNIM